MEMEEEKITIAVNKQTWDEFKGYCTNNAFKLSKKIELMMREEIERGPKTKNLIDVFKEILNKQKNVMNNHKLVEPAHEPKSVDRVEEDKLIAQRAKEVKVPEIRPYGVRKEVPEEEPEDDSEEGGEVEKEKPSVARAIFEKYVMKREETPPKIVPYDDTINNDDKPLSGYTEGPRITKATQEEEQTAVKPITKDVMPPEEESVEDDNPKMMGNYRDAPTIDQLMQKRKG